ncbi:MAG: hypothetical protein JW924_03115 [Fusobacteriaceae bacterium]|nr:hypothetical protein [Fusobacteriaceae bacterium]
MNVVNIHNQKSKVYLFIRDNDGNLSLKTDISFRPYFYEPDIRGKYRGYDGTPLRKIIVAEPKEVKHTRSEHSFESDILYTKRYIIDKVKEFNKCPIKWCFIDIEVLTLDGEFPNPEEAKYPVACITIYNSFSKEVKTWYLGDYKSKYAEKRILKDFSNYMKREKFDLWLSWNVDFDYDYLYNRVKNIFHKDLAKVISPINQVRYGKPDIFYPAGISIVDYLGLFMKVYKYETEYNLNYILEKFLEQGKIYKEVDFSKLNIRIKYRNIEDVKGMVNLEAKVKLLPRYDDMRRLSQCLWEDLPMQLIYRGGKEQKISNNSKMIDMLLLKTAKRLGVILPMKTHKEREKYQGAERDTAQKGRFFNVAQIDLSGAYPEAIINFCLDTSNISETEGIEIEGTRFIQNPKALLPTVTKQILDYKNQIKELKEKQPDNEDIAILYDAIKSIVNSIYGVFGSPFFRLYDKRIASATTFLVRDVLNYVVENLKAKGYDIIYLDTDGIMIQGIEDVSGLCNNLIQKWAKEKFGKQSITLQFDYEGYYTKVFIKALCHYIGYKKKGNKEPKKITKGIEAKKRNSSKFVKKFQPELIERILNNESKESIIKWIKEEIQKMKTGKIAMEEIAFPCKLGRHIEDYKKTTPGFVKALLETQALVPEFKPRIGQTYYYIYVEPQLIGNQEVISYLFNGRRMATATMNSFLQDIEQGATKIKYGRKEYTAEEFKKGIEEQRYMQDVISTKLAFDKKYKSHIRQVDWKVMVEKNIFSKVRVIFETMNWNTDYYELS